jgi:hypothetical protein
MHHHALAVEGYEPAIHDGITSDTQLHAHILHTYNAQFADVRFSYAAMAPELEITRALPVRISPRSPVDNNRVLLSAVFVSNCIEPRLSILRRFPISLFGECARVDTDDDNNNHYRNTQVEYEYIKNVTNTNSVDTGRWAEWYNTKLRMLSIFKFVVSIENSFEYGYMSEKFYASFSLPSVLVYMGAPDAHFSAPCRLLPFACFVNVFDFPSLDSVLDHLHELDRDYAKLMAYTRWKVNAKAYAIAQRQFMHYRDGMSPFETRKTKTTTKIMTTKKKNRENKDGNKNDVDAYAVLDPAESESESEDIYVPNSCKMCRFYREQLCDHGH